MYEEIPFYDDFRVPAGKPDKATADGTIKVEKVKGKGNRYVIQVAGDAMEPRIQSGDLILVDQAKKPRPGSVVIAIINETAVLKKFLGRKGQILLQSTNPRHADVEIREDDQFRIAGVVLRIVDGAL